MMEDRQSYHLFRRGFAFYKTQLDRVINTAEGLVSGMKHLKSSTS